MNNITKFEESFINLNTNTMVKAMFVLDIKKMEELYFRIGVELMEINQLEDELKETRIL